MSAARNPSKTARPTKRRDGFSLISTNPIVYDENNNDNNKFVDIT